jgi:hypothetical protein
VNDGTYEGSDGKTYVVKDGSIFEQAWVPVPSTKWLADRSIALTMPPKAALRPDRLIMTRQLTPDYCGVKLTVRGATGTLHSFTADERGRMVINLNTDAGYDVIDAGLNDDVKIGD